MCSQGTNLRQPRRTLSRPQRVGGTGGPVPPCRTAARASGASAAAAAAAEEQAGGKPPQSLELCRVWAVTDIHTDYSQNLDWVERIDGSAHRTDVLLLPGDCSDELPCLEATLGLLAQKFGAVVFVPGNHELWVREGDRLAGVEDSLTKLQLVLDLCRRLGVHTAPLRLGGKLWLAPLMSWHHACWDLEPDIPGVPAVSAWTVADYAACRWPASVPGGRKAGSLQLAQFFDQLNEGPAWQQLLQERPCCDVLSLSHFLPHQALLPEKRYLFYPNLMKAVGSQPLAERLALLQPDLHIFGHTHFAWDATLGGTRYIQPPLCSLLERQRRLQTVAFEACMEEAKEDPVAARWLPLLVYQTLLPAGTLGQASACSGAAAQLSSVVLPPGFRAGSNEPSGSSSNSSEFLSSSSGESRSNSSSRSSSSSSKAGAARRSSPSSGSSSSGATSSASSSAAATEQERQAREEWRAAGWAPLRHGAMVGSSLGAHWSSYYERYPRQPHNTVLAPWVAKRYERRQQRHAANLASSGGDSSLSSDAD